MSGAWTTLVSGALFPLHERAKGHDSVARRRALEASQWWPRERIEALRVERLRAFLGAAARDVPYYRELFAARGLDPARIERVADLAAYPLLTKADIRAHSERLRSDTAGVLKRYNTGGSSGEPLVFFMGKDRISHDVAAKWRATRWWDVDIGDRELVVWGSPVELGAQDRLRTLRDAMFRSQLLPAFEMSEANLDRFVARIRSVRPAMLFGYPSSLSLIAEHARRRGVRMDDLGIRVAFVTSERLYDAQRASITQVFGCPVANGYGGRDAGFIAHQCPQGSLHISAEDIIVETVDVDGCPVAPGERGEIVVTHMATADFPFIRYRTGDVGVLSEARCACGRGLPVLAEIEGRTTDFVVAADGTVMHGLALIYVVRDLPGIARFKIIQWDRQRTTVQLVPGPEYRAELEATIRSGLKARLGAGVAVEIECVADIPAERSGKFRYIVSHAGAPASAPVAAEAA
ncbi:MAG: phenylacetate--CoA ligase family protein [Burkholderiaceae bacterium]|jgi:phenylacetate-CoA ligase|nr:phenylacetate--CoA ligase family protein [Burkholderiaceae bacterium]